MEVRVKYVMPAARMGMVGNVQHKKLDVLAERLLVRYNA